MTATQSDNRESVDALPAAYAAWRRSVLGRITDALERERILDLIGPPDGKDILDVGCGDGVLALETSGRGAHTVGVDASEHMVAAARKRAKEHGAEVRFDIARADDLPFETDSFDVVVAITVLCFVEDAAAAFKEMVRVLKPGGRLIVGELGRFSAWAALRRVEGWLGSPVWRHARFRSGAELKQLAQEAGLIDASVGGAIYYPPFGIAARLLGPLDQHIGACTTTGAAFLTLAASKPRRTKAPDETRDEVDMKRERLRGWAGPAATAGALVACYGTLATIALLGSLGITIALNEAVWAGAIVVFAWLALLALWLRQRRHGLFWPIMLAAVGAVLITFTMTVTYERVIELVGFTFLCAGTFLDWRVGRKQQRPID